MESEQQEENVGGYDKVSFAVNLNFV